MDERDLSADRRRRKLRDLGRPSMMRGDEVERACGKLRALHGRGMTTTAMARHMDISESLVTQFINGNRYADRGGRPVTAATRRVMDKIASLVYVEPLPGESGALMPVTGARRRLRALMCQGYTATYLGAALGSDKAYGNRLVNGRTGQIYYSTHKRIAALFEKLDGTNPLDHGICVYGVARAKATAERNDYAPSTCWDPDTIDDPTAFAEWTGACGTNEGYVLHRKHGLNMKPQDAKGHSSVRCDPCIEAHRVHNRNYRNATHSFDLAEMRSHFAAGRSVRWIASEMGVSQRTVERTRKELEDDA